MYQKLLFGLAVDVAERSERGQPWRLHPSRRAHPNTSAYPAILERGLLREIAPWLHARGALSGRG
jgi:hypothetical protein